MEAQSIANLKSAAKEYFGMPAYFRALGKTGEFLGGKVTSMSDKLGKPFTIHELSQEQFKFVKQICDAADGAAASDIALKDSSEPIIFSVMLMSMCSGLEDDDETVELEIDLQPKRRCCFENGGKIVGIWNAKT